MGAWKNPLNNPKKFGSKAAESFDRLPISDEDENWQGCHFQTRRFYEEVSTDFDKGCLKSIPDFMTVVENPTPKKQLHGKLWPRIKCKEQNPINRVGPGGVGPRNYDAGTEEKKPKWQQKHGFTNEGQIEEHLLSANQM